MNRGTALAATAMMVGGLCLAGTATAAHAVENGEEDMRVTVDIEAVEEPGALSLRVAGTEVALGETEADSAGLTRVFTGSLPTVTVTDTRPAGTTAAATGWYVLGSTTALAGDAGQAEIGADALGWVPELVEGDASGSVVAGEESRAAAAGGAGLGEPAVLVSATVPSEELDGTEWSATAQVSLVTPADVAPGSYSSTFTLTLLE